ncbi:hypothetical protein [Knoellia sp. Soil729]|uniref:hypothetical protein n=1 Tax=Knoellia sp. Soil729 TaxID=1736394 RepID=UPI000700CD08|nr:hypothetical protein [Knoellia sp. Soil729]KRE43962.1 hypothetical protein ASG74_03800 [Knoellia sp. Soil729]
MGLPGFAAAYRATVPTTSRYAVLARCRCTLGGGAPVLPRHVELRLEEVARNREVLCGRYTVVR